MPQELPAVLTPLTPQEAAELVVRVLRTLTGEDPSDDCVFVFCAQQALETGWWKKCYANDFGNTKHLDGDGHDYCFYPAGEELDIRTAQALAAANPDTVKIICVYNNGNTASVHFLPKHPYCAFAAFETAADGMTFYLAKFTDGRYKPCMTYVRAGDPIGFANQAHQLHYFTADPAVYGSTLSSIARNYAAKLPAGWTAAAVPRDMPSADDQVRTDQMVQLAVDWSAFIADRDADVQAGDS